MAVILARLSNAKISEKLLLAFFAFSTFILGLVTTVGHSDIYYKSVQLVDAGGYHYLYQVI